MRFDIGTLDSGERSLPFGLLVPIINDRITGAGMTMIAIIRDNQIIHITNNRITGAGKMIIVITKDSQTITFVHVTTNRG